MAHSLYELTALSVNGSEWSAEVNCQQFVRQLLCKLNIPCDEPVYGDSWAPLMDCYCTVDGGSKIASEASLVGSK